MALKYCFVFPCYQHSATLDAIIGQLQKYDLKTFIVNDGSDAVHVRELERIAAVHRNIEIIHHTVNQGKGVAVGTGLKAAFTQGFTHALQIDSDGQHDLSRVDQLLELSKKFPEDVISGRPQYDATVPRSRFYGRYATHIWVWIETLSFQIQDSLYGFRSYPLKASIEVIQQGRVGARMDFDTEILVRLYWKGLDIHQFPVPVHYPEGGISHFDVLKDNVRITKMHTRLFFGMLGQIPQLIFRKPKSQKQTKSWHQIEEFGGIFGLRILLLVYKILGRNILKLILYPVCFYYSMVSSNAKHVSSLYRIRLAAVGGNARFSTFRHIYSFALAILDKFAVWSGDITIQDIRAEDVKALHDITNSGQGAFFLTSHYGNIEVCRALGRFYSSIQFHALVYHENAKRFNDYLNKVNSEFSLNLISVQKVGPEIPMFLKEKVDNKEWVFVVGDRRSVQDNPRTLNISLLGKDAIVSEGPFIIGYLLDVPIYFIHCFREGKQFRLQIRPVEKRIERLRVNRREFTRDLADQYAQELERVILKDPLQWFNFFDFWRTKV